MTTSSDNSGGFREQGNEAFKKGDFQEAIDRYTDALKSLNELQLNESIKNDLTKCYSNRSQCYINLGQYDDAIEDATRGKYIIISVQKHYFLLCQALEYTPADQKSLYRRANAFERSGKLKEAISDAQRLMSISPKGGPGDEQTNMLLRKLRENAQNKVFSYSLLFL
jgi:tetratricopeptide (TPR) repeat protein